MVTGSSLVTYRYGTDTRNSWRSEMTANVAGSARMRVLAANPKSPLRYEASTRYSLRISARAGGAARTSDTATAAPAQDNLVRARARSTRRSGPAEQSILEAGIGRVRSEPDTEQRLGEVGSRDDALGDALHLDGNPRSRQVRERHQSAVRHVAHVRVKSRDTILERREHRAGALLEPPVPRLHQGLAAHGADELHDEPLRLVGADDRAGVRRRRFQVRFRPVNAHL